MQSRLIDQAIAFALDIADEDDFSESVVVGLPDDGPPIPVFIDSDGLQPSEEAVSAVVEDLMGGHGVERWVSVSVLRDGLMICAACEHGRVCIVALVIEKNAESGEVSVTELVLHPGAMAASMAQGAIH